MTEKKPLDKVPDEPNHYDKFTWGPGDLILVKPAKKKDKTGSKSGEK